MAVTFAATFPRQIPKSVAVYDLQKPGVTQASVLELAKSLGLKGDVKEFTTSEEAITYAEQRYVLEEHRTSGRSATGTPTTTAGRPSSRST